MQERQDFTPQAALQIPKTDTLSRTSQRGQLVLLAALLVFAFAVRFVWIRHADYQYDDVALVLLAQAQADGRFQYFGIPSSNGGLNFPASVHFLALLFTLTPDIYGVMVGIVAFNVIGIGLLWLLARRLFTVRIAFVAALLLSISPWAIHFSRRIWAQEFNSPFLLAGMLFGVYGFMDGRKWAQLLSLPLLTVGLEIHFAAFALLPAYAALVWVGRKHIDWRYFLVSVVLAAILSSPLFIGMLSGGSDSPTILDRFSEQTSETAQSLSERVTGAPLQGLSDVVAGVGLDRYYNFAPNRLSLQPTLNAFALTLWAGGAIGLVIGLRRARVKILWIALWVFPALIVMATGVVDSHIFYFIMLLPPLLLTVALGLEWLAARLPSRWSIPVLVVFLGVLGMTQVGYMSQFFDHIWHENVTVLTPIGYLLQVRDHLPETDDLIMIGSRNLISEGEIWSTLLYKQGVCVRELAMEGGVDLTIVPAHPFLVMYGPEGLENPHYVNETRSEFPLRPGDFPYILYGFPTPSTAPLQDSLDEIAIMSFASALQLQQVGMADGRVALSFQVTQLDRTPYHFFVHFLDAAGERIGQFDAPFYPGTHWCEGDRYYLSFAVPQVEGISERTAMLRIGMYRLEQDNIIGIDAFDRAGNSFPWVDIEVSR